jgi:hypothetical protein
MILKRLIPSTACSLLLMVASGTPAPAGTDGNTPVGTNVTVPFLDGYKLVFTNVVTGGNTTTIRTDLAPGVTISPCGTPIPSYLTPPAGDNHFAVFRIETTAGFTDTVDLNLVHPDGNARVFRAACPPPRDAGWEDVTVLPVPGDARGRTPLFSEFMLVDDLRSVSTLITNKINALIGLVGPGSAAATFVDPQTLATLQSMVNTAAQAISAGNKQAAIVDLQNFNQFVLANSGVTIPNKSSSPGGNIAGALVGKASTLIFSLSL